MNETPASSVENPCVRESLLQEHVGDNICCNVCERRCVLAPGAVGWCRTRQYREGTLKTRIFGAISAVEAEPVEKKPFYHFYPGTWAMTAGSFSCNFDCPWCENWEITHTSPPRKREYISPERFVGWTENAGCQGTCISFNEPTLALEWSLEVFRLARERGLYNTYVTNGYMTPEALDLLIEAGLDAMNVDLKGEAETVRGFCPGVEIEKVWALCRLARRRGVHLEITTLVIPNVNNADDHLRQTATRIVDELGAEVPWHLAAYTPAYKFTEPATPQETLERAWRIGASAGLQFVYAGNLPGHRYANTHCPDCGALLIRRLGTEMLLNTMWHGRCPDCARQIAGVWTVPLSTREILK